jgi:hypothetical protein
MKIKQFLLTIVFLTLTIIIHAQDKFDFMTIIHYGGSKDVAISINGTEFKKEDVTDAASKKSGFNSNGILLKIKEYQDKNWELVNLQLAYPGSAISEVYFAYLRKKKTETK